MRKLFLFLVSLFAFAGVVRAETIDIAAAKRPTAKVEGDTCVVTFPDGHGVTNFESYGKDHGIIPVKLEGNVAKIPAADWFNYTVGSKWALVSDGKRHKWSAGIDSEPTKRYGGRADKDAALKCDPPAKKS